MDNQEFIDNFKKVLELMSKRIESCEHLKVQYESYIPIIDDLKHNIGNIIASYKVLFLTERKVNDLLDFEGRYNFSFNKSFDIVRDIHNRLYNEDGKMLDLEEQNEIARTYHHFDYSMKKPKTISGKGR